MRRFAVFTGLLIVSLYPAAASAQDQKSREVILATRRNQQVVVFDARTLAELGHFIVNPGAEGVTASPDGRTLYLQQHSPSRPGGCCALFSLDLETGAMCELIFPSGPAVATPDGTLLFTQRGPIGVEVFDAKSLARLPVIKAPGGYVLYASPDSRWLFGASGGVDASLDIFDLGTQVMVRRLPLTGERIPRGAWIADRFYLYAHNGTNGNLWQVTPDTAELASPKKIALPVPGRSGQPAFQQVIAAGDRLIVYEPLGWWFTLDRSENPEIPGGMFSIDPATGVFEHLAPATNFHQVVASADGSNLYGIDAGAREQTRPPRLLKVDRRTGAILKKRDLARDIWHIGIARLPESLIPRGRNWTTPCHNPNAGLRQQ